MEWFPWYPARYKDKTLHLTAEQDGIYRRLIDHYMETRRPLPDSNLALARISGVTLECFEHASSIIRAFFKHGKDGVLTHQTCDEMLNEQDGKAKFRTDRAKKAAEKRWSNQPVTQSSNAHSMPEAMLGDATVNNNSKDIGTNVPIIKPSPDAFNQFWELYPRQRRGSKDKALLAYKAAIKRGNTEQQIIDGVKTYATSSDVTRGYAKGCTAWLNDDGFLNDHSVKVGNSAGRAAGGNRGFDALAVAAREISEDVEEQELDRLRHTDPDLYLQRRYGLTGGGNHLEGSAPAAITHQPDAASAGTGSGEETRSN